MKKRSHPFDSAGYRTLVIWEHELKNPDQCLDRIASFVTTNPAQEFRV